MHDELAQKLLRELLNNSKRSDRKLGRLLKVSQPTITRARHRLEKDGLIDDYTIVPDFKKMGFEIMALTFVKMKSEILSSEMMRGATEYAAKFPNAIFASTGEGLGMTGVIISFERNYSDYHRHLNLLRVDWKDFTEDIQSFIIALGEGDFKKFSLSHLKNVPL